MKEAEIGLKAIGYFSVTDLISYMAQGKPTGMVSPGGWSV